MSQPSEEIAEELARTAPATVLCVDDESNILSALRRLLRSQGYKLLFAQSGVEGLALMEQEEVDLVISDMRMPEMDGASFLIEVANRWPDTMRILLTGYSDMDATIETINKAQIFKYITKPWEDNNIILSIQHALELKNLESERRRLEALTRKQNEELQDLNAGLESKVKQRTAEIEQTLAMYESTNEELKQSYSRAVDVFSNLVAIRRGESGADMRRLAETARAMALELGMGETQAQDVYHAELLCNIGQIGLPDSLLKKPLSSLSADDRDNLLKHSVTGQGLLMALEPLQNVASIIGNQNEHFDGSGQPAGLKGAGIPLGARIIAVINDYHGLKSGVLTGEPHSPSEARQVIARHRGKRYDPEVVDAFAKVVESTDEDEKQEDLHVIKSNGLVPGMALARDLLSESGLLLLSKGHVITQEIIARIDTFERSTNEDLTIVIADGRES